MDPPPAVAVEPVHGGLRVVWGVDKVRSRGRGVDEVRPRGVEGGLGACTRSIHRVDHVWR